MPDERKELLIPPGAAGRRLDSFLAERLAELSRTGIARLIRGGSITVDGRAVKPKHLLRGGEWIHIALPDPRESSLVPESIPIEILYEDEHVAIVNKPAGMLSHPSASHQRGTLAGALLARLKDLSGVGGELRPGIVHRLDKNTSGLMVVAKNDAAHRALSAQFKARTVEKEYAAVVHGSVEPDYMDLTKSIGKKRWKSAMKVTASGREARTIVRTIERLGGGGFTHVAAFPKTGRTHQVRVHLAERGYPLLADPTYGREKAFYASTLSGERGAPGEEPLIARHALHSRRMAFAHPATGARMEFASDLPEDMKRLLAVLKERRP